WRASARDHEGKPVPGVVGSPGRFTGPRRSGREDPAPQGGDGVDNAREALPGASHGVAGAQVAVHQPLSLMPDCLSCGSNDAVTVRLAIGGQRITLGRDDDGWREA